VSDLLGSANRVRHGGNGFLEIARPFKAHRDQQARREEHKATLAEIGLDVALIDARIEDLSHGILKVIDIARSIQTATSVLLLDEPTSGLSQHELDLVGTLIRKASSSDAAVVVVEHNVQFLLGVADHVLVLHQGAELASGEPEATFNKPEVAAAYLGISI
jgi:branched-chain amino acid transport system ATP-binding protein